MAGTRAKSRYILEQSLIGFIERNHGHCFYWTFTFHDNVTDKREAERRIKPFFDYLDRKRASCVGVWERQARGAWHPHLLTDAYLDVNELRPWLKARGFGAQMRVEWIGKGSHLWQDPLKLVRYLIKYLGQEYRERIPGRERLAFFRWGAKCGSTKFHWNTSLSKLWREGQTAFLKEFRRRPTWKGRLWDCTSQNHYSDYEWVREWVETQLLDFASLLLPCNPYASPPATASFLIEAARVGHRKRSYELTPLAVWPSGLTGAEVLAALA